MKNPDISEMNSLIKSRPGFKIYSNENQEIRMNLLKNKACLTTAVLLIISLMAGCSTMRQVKPLALGEHKASLSLGGPLFDSLGVPIPIPVISVDYQYGLTPDLTVGGAFHITPLLFKLFGMWELDALYGLLRQNGAIPGVSLFLNGIFYSDFSTSFFALPEIGAIPYWDLSKNIRIYTGLSALINLYPKTAGLPHDAYVIPVLLLGTEFVLGHFEITVECKYIHPGAPNLGKAIHFVGLGDYGSLAPYLAFSYRFGGEK